MALVVIKVYYRNIVRRWTTQVDDEASSFTLTLKQIEEKIREWFHLSPTAKLFLTYTDQENEIVTMGNDCDLVDACVVQRINPLRLVVHVSKGRTSSIATRVGSLSTDTTIQELSMRRTLMEGSASRQNVREVILPQVLVDLLSGFLDGYQREIGNGTSLSDLTDENICALEQNPNDVASQEAVHTGVRCDACGMLPIKGIRYKSTKLHNFDLCATCFEVHGKESAFQKLVHPVYHNSNLQFWARRFMTYRRVHPAHGSSGQRAGCVTDVVHPFIDNTYSVKLDANFIEDISVPDGMELYPGTKFTKIWRLRNTGTVPWPSNTKLVHIGKDELSSESTIYLEFPEGGVPCGEDFDVSVELVAPQEVGCYVSYWCLACMGKMFGHKLYAEIRVIPVVEESPVSSCFESDDDTTPQDGNATEYISENCAEAIRHNQPDTDDNEVDGFSLVELGEIAEHHARGCIEKQKMQYEELLQALESEVNVLLLDNQNQNAQQNVYELVASAGLDGLLNELQEMGFQDELMNIRLLAKNKGSLKIAVKELLDMEKRDRTEETST